MTKRTFTSLRDKIHVKHGFPFKGEHFNTLGPYVVLTPGNFYEEGGFKRNAAKDKCYSESFPEEYLLKKGDILVAMTEQTDGLLGSMAKIPESDRFLHNQRLGLVTALTSDVDVEFLFHLFKTKSVREQIRRSASGSKVKHTSPERIYDVQVQLPSPRQQSAIAKLLSALDDKTELNNRVNKELEGMAKLLYDYWFVQFDFPITAAQAAAMGKSKLEGKPYRASGGKMIFNEALKREIPEGWDVLRVSDVLAKELRTKNILSSEIADRGRIPVVDQGSAFICGFTDDEDSIINETPKIVFGDHTRILKFINFPFARGADGTQVLTSREDRLPQHLFFWQLLSFDLSSYGYARHFKFLKDQKVVLPGQAVASAFDQIAASLYTKIKNNIFENQQLAELRDWLLPMLMNGQVTVS